MNPKHAGGAAIFCAIVCPSANIGLFVRQPDRPDPCWKIAAGEVESNESIPAALLRETEEETGFVIPNVEENGLVVGNADCRCHFLYSDSGSGRMGIHERHYFVVIVKDPTDIIALDGQIRKEDDQETIETKVFDLDAVLAIPDFLPQQRPLLLDIVDFAKKLRVAA